MDKLYRAANEGSHASYLRRQHAERGSAQGMVDAALQRLRSR
jgi:carboxylate-amine ligase